MRHMNKKWQYLAAATSRLRVKDIDSGKLGVEILPGQLAPLPAQGQYRKGRRICFDWGITTFKLTFDTTSGEHLLMLADTEALDLDEVEPRGEMPDGYGYFYNCLLSEDCYRNQLPLGWSSSDNFPFSNTSMEHLYDMFISLRDSVRSGKLYDRPVGSGIPVFFWVGDKRPDQAKGDQVELFDVVLKTKVKAWRIPHESSYKHPGSIPFFRSRGSGYVACGLQGPADESVTVRSHDVWPNGWWATEVGENPGGLYKLLEAYAGNRRTVTVCS